MEFLEKKKWPKIGNRQIEILGVFPVFRLMLGYVISRFPKVFYWFLPKISIQDLTYVYAFGM